MGETGALKINNCNSQRENCLLRTKSLNCVLRLDTTMIYCGSRSQSRVIIKVVFSFSSGL